MAQFIRHHEIHWSAWKDSDGWGVCTADGDTVIVQPNFSHTQSDMLRIVRVHNGDLDRRLLAAS